MEPSTTIRKMMAGNKIIVPAYQRAYSWDTPIEKSDRNTQTDVFLSDLEEYRKSNARSPYYFGHFLFEKKDQETFYVIDGQQRLTTIVIFLSALFDRLKLLRTLSENEEICYEDMIKRRSTIRFQTVDYDNQLFNEYVIDQTKTDHNSLKTESARRIVRAFDFFKAYLSNKPEDYLVKILSIIENAACTTHLVQNESEAIQMFIFQNNRGKRPTNLEIVKAQFMYNVHLHGTGKDEVDSLVGKIKDHFEEIYESISSIEHRINEDDVLLYALRVYFNSLWEASSLDKINEELSKNPIDFIKSFTRLLATCFKYLEQFFNKDERKNFAIHSLVSLGGIGVAIPFIIKAYKYGLPLEEIGKLCSSLESLVLRHRLIGTRADITSRINDVFEKFSESNKDISPIIEHIEWMKTTTDWWWAYWNNERLIESLQGGINHSVAKYLLWKYEVHLEQQGKAGYSPIRFDSIINPELEHIAPKTENPESGYDTYDEEFVKQYIDCLGNYLLVSKSHNCSVGNKPFVEKRASYKHLEQQREIQEMTKDNPKWTRNHIQRRKEKIIHVLMSEC